MELKPGYKQTEAGVIPEDWNGRPLGSIGKPVRGGSPRPAGDPRYFNGAFIPWLTVAAMTNIPSSQLTVTETETFLTEEGSQLSRMLNPGTLIIANSGATLGVAKILGIKCCANDGIAALLNIKSDISPHFLAHLINAKTHYLREVVATGNGQPNLNTKLIGDFTVQLPPTRVEQDAVSDVLSDADMLIQSLEQLLVKKRQIKQGAMQELLTGRKRLPGFTEKWKSKLFGEIAQPRKQRIDPRRTASNEFCIELEHIEQATGFLGGYTATDEGSSLKSVFQKDDVLFGKLRAYLRKYWLADREGVCSTEIWVLVANSASLVPPYLFQIVRTERFIEAASTAYGTHMPRSDWNVVKNFELQVPPPEEQIAIADILSDMDAEIISLETKLAKARRIKQGMMHELLTGRIRLVRPSAQVLSFPAKDSASVAKVSHNTQLNEAVVIAVLSARFGSDKFPLGRFRRTKLSYLLHRHVEHEAAGFMKKAAGPYNPRTRYGGAEKIALQNRYVRVLSTGKSEGFVADENIAQAEGYFEKWYGEEALTWLEQFRYQKNDALELLTTVDMACQDLSQAGKAATLSAVKQIIHDSPEWKAKLNRAVFSDDNIATTIQSCGQLFPIEKE